MTTCTRREGSINFLPLMLDYYNTYWPGLKITLGDSGDEATHKFNEDLITKYPNLNINYVYVGYKCKFPRKIIEMTKATDTKYSAICSDDDYMLPSGIEAASTFLENNSDYSSAHGTLYRFDSKKKTIKYKFRIKMSDSDDQLERVLYHMNNLSLLIWSCTKTENLEYIYKECEKYLNSDINPIVEHCDNLLRNVRGKVKTLKCLYFVKRKHFDWAEGTWDGITSKSPSGTYKDYDYIETFDDVFWNSIYPNFIDCIMNNLDERYRTPETRKLIEEAYERNRNKQFTSGFEDNVYISEYYDQFKDIKRHELYVDKCVNEMLNNLKKGV